nr:SDR family NAD(P)-dependent oxidoreductase [Candidatus Omnitrophota bacterium]
MGKVRENKNVLVTGVAGFIGSNLAKVLLDRGYRVIGLDNLSQGLKRNIKPFLSDKNFKFIKADVRKNKKIENALKGYKIDYIVHLAAFKIPRYGN